MIYAYMIPIYAFLVKHKKRRLEDLPELYQIPVTEYLANEAENAT